MHAAVRSPSEPRFKPRRELGRTGFIATQIGAGDLADRTLGVETCADTLLRALEAGINVVDTAPAYEDGFSEEIVGRALAKFTTSGSRSRADIFVIDKIDHLDRPVAPQIAGSVHRSKLPSVDLFVFHNVSTLEAWNALAAPGGGFAALRDAIRLGQARFAGISSHHPEVLDRALATDFCDVLMFPVGPHCDRRYVDDILPRAKAKNIGVVSFKTFGAGKLLGDVEGYGRALQSGAKDLPRLGAGECIDYTLTLDPDVALLGLSTPDEQDAAFAAVDRFRPIAAERCADIRARAAAAVAGKGGVWWDPKP